MWLGHSKNSNIVDRHSTQSSNQNKSFESRENSPKGPVKARRKWKIFHNAIYGKSRTIS